MSNGAASSSSENGFGGVLATGRLDPLVRASIDRTVSTRQWDRYAKMLGSAKPDEGESRLYPMVAAQLGSKAAEQPRAELLLDARRLGLAREAMTFDAAAQAADRLAAQGMRAIFPKGLALQMRYYRTPGMRYSADVDLFVLSEQVARALAALEQSGFERVTHEQRAMPADWLVRYRRAVNLRAPNGIHVDIRWAPARALEFQPSAGREFAADAVTVDYGGREWVIPAPAWLLFETIEHGMAYNEVAPIRWIPDALQIIRDPSAAIDWDWFLDLARSAKVCHVVATGLAELARFGAAIPPEVSRGLAAERTSWLERFHARVTLRPPRQPFASFSQRSSHYFLRGNGSFAEKLVRFPIRYRESVEDTPSWGSFVRKGIARIAGIGR